MFSKTFKAALSASALVLTTAAFSLPAEAQTRRGGTSGGVEGRDVRVGTSGYGETNGRGSATVGGTAGAEAGDGGRVSTNVRARTNERRAVNVSTARARDEDERARSRTRTVVRNGHVRSRTTNVYRERGQAPQRTTTRSNTRDD